MDKDHKMRRVQSMPSLSQTELKAELDTLRREVSELREAIAVFEGEHARWATRYGWRLAFYSNLAYAAFFLGHRLFHQIRRNYRISGLLGEFLVPQALRVRGGFSNVIINGLLKGLQPAAPFVIAVLLLLRKQGWLRTLGGIASCGYSAWLCYSGVYTYPSAATLVANALYMLIRALYRVEIADLVPSLRRVLPK